MSYRRIILCLDGTWNNTYTESERDDGSKVLKPSNVLKIARAVSPVDTSSNIDQLTYYDPGVGAMSDYPGRANRLLKFFDKRLGGAFGAGFEANIEEALTYLVNNYRPGSENNAADKVFIYGFSRGAATARALCKFIDWMGGIPSKKDAYFIPIFLRNYLSGKGKVSLENVKYNLETENATNKNVKFNPMQPIAIELLGVWDTVVALSSRMYMQSNRTFLVGESPPRCVLHAFHALAVDEQRADFLPEIWTSPGETLHFEQKWFSGVHSNIGGGYNNDGLANISLAWIVEKSMQFGLSFDQPFLRFYRPYYQDKLYESKDTFYKLRDFVLRRNGVRRIGGKQVLKDNSQIHYSVLIRLLSDASEKKLRSDERKYPRLEPYEPENLISFLKEQTDPLQYCLNVWVDQRKKNAPAILIEKLTIVLQRLDVI